MIELRGLGLRYRLTPRRERTTTVKEWLFRWTRPAPARRELWALRNVDLTCHEGQTLGVVGNNGAGKSTLCLVLSQILQPDEGTLTVRGQVSALFSLGAGFNAQLSGRENIALYAAFLGLPRDQLGRKIDEIVEFSELAEFIDEPVAHYSTGMRARLGFSVAATLKPDVLLLDEIMGVGDQQFKKKSEDRLRQMMAESRVIVVVSHNLTFVREVCTHCLWLERGEVRRYGPVAEVLDAYEASGA